MSGQSDLKSTTCPKCRNKNPMDAAFCGFCGADLRSRNVPEKATMFGYVADLGRPMGGAPSKEIASTPESNVVARPAGGAESVGEEAPTTAYTAGQGYVAGRYWLQSDGEKIPIGERFHAKDSQTNSEVALTLIDNANFPSPLDMERTRRELRQLQKVNNKHLERVLDHGKHDDGRLYVVTELVQGSTLDSVIDRGPLDLVSAKQLVNGVGAGLSAAQTVGIVHRDIAPHNVVIGPDGEPKVRALGAAPRLKDHIHGTAEFLSPEQAAGRPVDQRSNIYSLGSLMFYAMTGRPPFSGTTEEVLEQQRNAEPPDLSQAGASAAAAERVQAVLDKAMSKNSSKRHLTLRQFLREIDALSTDLTPAAGSVAVGPSVPAFAQTEASSAQTASSASLAETILGGAPPAGLVPADSEPIPPTGQAVAASHEVTPEATPEAAPVPARPARQVVVTDEGALVAEGLAETLSSSNADTQPPVAPSAPDDSRVSREEPAVAAPPLEAVDSGGEVEEPQIVKESLVPLVEQPATRSPAITAAGAQAVAGEMSGGERVRLSKTSEQQVVAEATGSAPATPASGATPSGPGLGGKGFRETMWFFKGEVESAMAEKGEAVSATDPDDNPDLAHKYADDGSIDDDAARRLSLRTGKTQMMQAAQVPSGHVPGEKMRAEEFIGEINQGRKVGLVIVALIVAAAVGVAFWLLLT